MVEEVPVIGLRFAAEMDARPRIQADLAFWAAHSRNAGAEAEAALIPQLSDEYLVELRQATQTAALKAYLENELMRRQACWLGAHGRLQRLGSRIGASVASVLALRPAFCSAGILADVALDAGADGQAAQDHRIAVRAETPSAKMGHCHSGE